jgi:membrane associated rhomboid family serine protease
MTTPIDTVRPDARRLTPAVQVLIALNAAIMFLQWAVVSSTDVFAVLGFQDGSLERTLWSAVTYSFAHYGFWHLAVNMRSRSTICGAHWAGRSRTWCSCAWGSSSAPRRRYWA